MEINNEMIAIERNKGRTAINAITWLLVGLLMLMPYVPMIILYKEIPTEGYVVIALASVLFYLPLAAGSFICSVNNFKMLKNKYAIWSDEGGVHFYTNSEKLGYVYWKDIDAVYLDKFWYGKNNIVYPLVVVLNLDQTSSNNFGPYTRFTTLMHRAKGGNRWFFASLALCKGKRRDNAQIVIDAFENYKMKASEVTL